MRKNSPRKWLHAILDFLPLLVLPIFALAVRSDNNFQPMTVDVVEDHAVEFNQLMPTNYSGSITPSNNFISYTSNNGRIDLVVSQDLTSDYQLIIGNLVSSDHITSGHTYATRGTLSDKLYITYNSAYSYLPTDIRVITFQTSITIAVRMANGLSAGNYTIIPQLFDLTDMFGLETPSISEFDTYFPNEYYSRSFGVPYLIHDYVVDILNDTDVGSQMTYTLYHTVDRYFNVSKVFNLTQITDWLTLNIFGGTMPLGAYVVWNILVYQFVIDLLFILYTFFMFLIDFTEYVLEKPFNKVTRC